MTIYLYVKQHSLTGLKYFGKTISKDPYRYLGSGKIWKRHIKKHGIEFVETIHLWSFNNLEKANEFALRFSKQNSIVESSDWANLIDEDAIGGGPLFLGGKHTDQSKSKISNKAKERLKVKSNNPMFGKTHSIEAREKMSKANKGKTISEYQKSRISEANKNKIVSAETRMKMSNSFKGRKMSEEAKQKISLSKLGIKYELRSCPHCNTQGAGPNMSRYHFDKCKSLQPSIFTS